MNTGAGKTLTGLLMLYSKLIEGYGPALYVCPDKQLVDQVIEQAHNYGIPACAFDAKGDYPSEFLNKQSVLVCNFEKLFNGKSIFVRDNIQPGAVLLDDAHTGIRRVRQNATITIPRRHSLFQRLLLLFREDLENQGAGTFARISDKEPSPRALMRVRYWAWVSKNAHVVRMINAYRKDDAIDFAWQLLADDLLQCDCVISSQGLEISPTHVPYPGVSVLLEPLSILDPAKIIDTLPTPETQAHEMEHALRHEIGIRRDQVPVGWTSLRQRLDEVIQVYKKMRLTLAELLKELSTLREEAGDLATGTNAEGLSPTLLAFRAQLSAMLDTEGHDADRMTALAESVVDELERLKVMGWQVKEDVQREMQKRVRRSCTWLESLKQERWIG